MGSKTWFVAVLGAFCAVIAIGGSALADAKVFPGSSCRQLFGEAVSYSSVGRVSNYTDTETRILCPIVRDETTSGWNQIEVLVKDRSDDEDVFCVARSTSRSGDVGYFSTRTSSGSANTWQTLQFGSISEYDKGMFLIYCDLPAYDISYSALGSYYVDE